MEVELEAGTAWEVDGEFERFGVGVGAVYCGLCFCADCHFVLVYLFWFVS